MLFESIRKAIWFDETQVVFVIGPEEVRPIAAQLEASERAHVRSMEPEALSRQGRMDLHPRLVAELSCPAPRQLVHLIEIDRRVVAWGFSAIPDGAWPLEETASSIDVAAGGVCLTAFETLPEYRGRRFYPAILTQILQQRFAEGAPIAYIWCSSTNRASYASIKRVGFREIAAHRYTRRFGVTRRSVRRLSN